MTQPGRGHRPGRPHRLMSYHRIVDILNRILPWDGWGGRIMATVMASGNADMEIAAVELVDPQPDSSVVMIGCGPGVGVVAAARRVSKGAVIGLDPSAVMVERSRTRCRQARVEHLTTVERAAAESLPLPDGSQDAVVSVNNIQLWNDRSAGLDECARVLAPQGVMVVLLPRGPSPTRCQKTSGSDSCARTCRRVTFVWSRRRPDAFDPVLPWCSLEGRRGDSPRAPVTDTWTR